jgi:hypothetical protein
MRKCISSEARHTRTKYGNVKTWMRAPVDRSTGPARRCGMFLALSLVALLALACADVSSLDADDSLHPDPLPCAPSVGLTIFNGSDASVAVDACGARAIVGIERTGSSFPESWCTGVVIADGTVLTAAHCVVDPSGDSAAGDGDGGMASPLEAGLARLLIGPSLWTPEKAIPSTGGFVSGTLDIAVLDFPATELRKITPIPLLG